MAQSRLEKIGTIFTRVTGLLRSEAMKVEDKPIWYDVYSAFPPKLEPRFDRPVDNVPLKNIFYAEDLIRAKYQKSKQLEAVNLADSLHDSHTQRFIAIYNNLKFQGALDENKIMETAEILLEEYYSNRKAGVHEKSNLLIKPQISYENSEQIKKNENNNSTTPINIKDLFKE